MRIAYMQMDLNNLEINKRVLRTFQGVEKGRKKGADLVILPLFNNEFELTEMVLKASGFLRGTLDYPFITLLLGAKTCNGLNSSLDIVFFGISEEKIINKTRISNDNSNVISVLGWEIIIKEASKELKTLLPRIEATVSKKGVDDLNRLNSDKKAYLFLDDDSNINALLCRGSLVNLDKRSSKVTIIDL